jgi:hypothetical protein
MYSTSAAQSFADPRLHGSDVVTSVARLEQEGWSTSKIRGQIRARRWQRIGRAVVRHNAAPTRSELRRAALIVLGPRVLLTSFTALEERGLSNWDRDQIHVLVPRGARVVRPRQLPLRVHYTDRWTELAAHSRGATGPLGHAALLAAASFAGVRPACAILAATVQQQLMRPEELTAALARDGRIRHHHALVAAAHDIGQGAQALSEIDFVRLCRRYGLPEPIRQAVRVQPDGLRRYLDSEWKSRSGQRIVAEVDGALHLIVKRWWDDQLRQNELTISGDRVLRFPTVVVRAEPDLVASQLRRALLL